MMMRYRSTLFVLLFALFSAAPAHAAISVAMVLVDSDNDAQTGCAGFGGVNGVEQEFITTVDRTTSVVTSLQRRQCSGGVFTAPVSLGGAWPASVANGATQVELQLPLTELGPRDAATPMRIAFVISDERGTTTIATMPDGSPILHPKPTTKRRRSARPADGTQTIVIDGNISDWARLEPLLDRALQSIYMHGGNAQLFFRFDLREASQAPVATNDSYAVRQGKTLVIDAPGVLENDTDAEGNDLSAVLVAPSVHGTVALAADGSFVYSSDGTLAGDGFDYKASDGGSESNAARVTINVTPNAAPVAQNDTYATSRGGTLTVPAPGVIANDGDPDGDPLSSATVATSPARGAVTLAADGSFTYTHNGSTEPSDTFTYTVSDGLTPSVPASVTINVSASNAPPVAVDDVFHVLNGGTLDVTAPGLFSNDLDSDTPQSQWTTTVIAAAAHGVLTVGTGGAFTYVHDGSGASDTFTYRVSDGAAQSNVATVTIVVGATNAPPLALADSYTTNEDTTLTVQAPGVLQNDSDPEGVTLTATVVANPSSGTLALNPSGAFVYTPNANANGTDTFTYRVSDGSLFSSVVTVTIAVNAVNDAPVTSNDAYTVAEGGTLTIAAAGVLANDSDIDNATLTVSTAAEPLAGTLTLNANGSFTYVHDGSESSSDTFKYSLSDGTASRLGTVTIDVTPVNDDPIATADSKSTSEDTPVTFAISELLANDSAGDGETTQTITFTTAVNAVNGALLVNGGNVTFTPAPNFNGTATFGYTIVDNGTTGAAADPRTASALVTIIVTPANDAPSFTSTAITAALEEVPYAYAIAAADVDTADALTITATGLPAWLTLTDNGNRTATLTGTPSNAHVGSYPITLTVTDGTANAAQTFTLIVANVNDAPVAAADAAALTEDAATTVAIGNVLANDTDVDTGDTLTATPVAASGTYGNLTIAANGAFSYTIDNTRAAVQALANGATQTDVFNYVVLDGNGGTATAALTVTITGANDAPL
ncbi:MAG TPA: Ig-like domain-containing protein, partial [Thermoanaerobaculia bacterium]|nr:Ig-like domain-containing protein [Thermoanaerobaculia bacterium]